MNMMAQMNALIYLPLYFPFFAAFNLIFLQKIVCGQHESNMPATCEGTAYPLPYGSFLFAV
jgi:hypothetical protein